MAAGPAQRLAALAGRARAGELSGRFELKRGIIALSASSEVNVADTTAEADGTLTAIRSPRVRACFSRYLTALLKSQQHAPAETVLGVSIASGTPPAPGTTGGFGWPSPPSWPFAAFTSRCTSTSSAS